MIPHPCPYCSKEMNKINDLHRCGGCGFTDGKKDDTTRQGDLPPSFL